MATQRQGRAQRYVSCLGMSQLKGWAPVREGLFQGFWEQASAEFTAPQTMPAFFPGWPPWVPTSHSFLLRTGPENTVALLHRSNVPLFWTVSFLFFFFFFFPLASLSSLPPGFTVLTIVSNRCAARPRRLWSSCLQTHGYSPTISLESWGPKHTDWVSEDSLPWVMAGGGAKTGEASDSQSKAESRRACKLSPDLGGLFSHS